MTDKTMTLEQVRDVLRDEHPDDVIALSGRMADAIDAHLARQSEGVSDEYVREAAVAYMATDTVVKGWEPHVDDLRRMRAALTAVWHNRPTQEKAWDARGGSLWADREDWGVVIDALIEHRASSANRKNGNPESTSDARAEKCGELIGRITTAAKSMSSPSAERVRVPDGWKLVPIKMTEEMQRAGSGFNYIENAWNAVLDAAPEADHHV